MMTFGRRPSCVFLVLLAAMVPPASAQGPKVEARKAEYEAAVETDVMIPMRDRVKLAADVYRPARDGQAVEGKFPALLTRTPYNKGHGDAAEGKYYASRGYVVVMNDVRGRYASEGNWRMMVDDPNDGYDVVEWIARQPWSDGKVGTFGTSYPGGTQHALAEMNPPHLTTMVPVDALSNTGIAGMRHGGAFELRFMNWIFNQGATGSKAALASPALKEALVENARRIRQHVDRGPVFPGTTPLRVVPEYEGWLVEALRSGPRAALWESKGMSVLAHVSAYADVPVLHVTGWYDSWTRQVSLNYEALSKAKRSPQHLLIGPWVHGGQRSNVAGEVEFSADAGLDFDALRLRWYDRWLMGRSNGVEDDPPVYLYIMGTGDDRKSAAGRLRHGGYWRSEKEWPLTRARATSYFLGADGSLETKAAPDEARLTYTFDPRHPVPTIGGNISSNTNLMTNGGYDQRPRDDTHAAEDRLPLSERKDVLVFRTGPLAEAVEVTGTVEVRLWVSSTAPDTDFSAKLLDEIPPNPDYPLGFDLNVGDAIVRLRDRGLVYPPPEKPEGLSGREDAHFRASLEGEHLLEPGQMAEVVIRLYPTAHVFKAGHRLRVDVSSSNYPRFDVNSNTGEPLGRQRRFANADNTVHVGGRRASRMIVPIVPGGSGR